MMNAEERKQLGIVADHGGVVFHRSAMKKVDGQSIWYCSKGNPLNLTSYVLDGLYMTSHLNSHQRSREGNIVAYRISQKGMDKVYGPLKGDGDGAA